MVWRSSASRDSPNDALWDLDAVHGDEFLQLVQTGHVLYLAAELGAVTSEENKYIYFKKGFSVI